MEAELTGSGLVIDTSATGPRLCLGAVAASWPPQGSGPLIANWDWTAVSEQESDGSTTWGAYTVVGRYHDGVFTMTRPPTPRRQRTRDEPDATSHPSTTPCPAPPGGWRVLDPALTSTESLDRTLQAARRLPGFADVWLDRSIADDDATAATNDPEGLVLNVAVAGDTAGADATLRQTWGGALCVSPAARSSSELQDVFDDVETVVGERMLVLHKHRGRVHVEVIHDDGTLQALMDQRHLAGVVQVHSALRPVGAEPTVS